METKYKDLTITKALEEFKKDYSPAGTNGYNRKFYIISNYIKYPTTTNVEYNNKLNSFEDENSLILYIITEGLEYQDRTLNGLKKKNKTNLI